MAGPFCGNSTFWDEAALLDNWYPEFTTCFQQTVLTYIPCGWLWLTGIIHFIYLQKHRQCVALPTTWLSAARLVFVLILCLLSGFHMLIPLDKSGSDEIYPPSFYVSKSLWAASYLLALVLMILSQRSGVASPCIIFIFWTLTLVTHVIPVYVLSIQKDYEDSLVNFILVCTTFGLIVTEFILQCAGDTKVYLLVPSRTGMPCPSMTSSFVSRLLYSWVFRLVYLGYKKVVVLSDIWDLPTLMQCHFVVPGFLSVWMEELRRKGHKTHGNSQPSYINGSASQKNGKVQSPELEPTEKTSLLPHPSSTRDETDVVVRKGKASLYKVLGQVFYLPLLKAQIVGLIGDVVIFLNPILLDQIIAYVENKDGYPRWQGFFLAGSFFVVMFLNSMTNNFRFYHSQTIGIKVKTALTAAVYKKSLTMNAEARRKFTTGTIVNLMAVDCPTFQELTVQLYVIISWPVQISIAFYMLHNTLGISFIAGIVVLLMLIPTNAKISTLARRAQAAQISLKDQRIKLLSEIINGMRVLKLYAWEPSFQEKIQKIRHLEVIQLKKAAVYQSINTLCWLLSPVLVIVATFITYVLVTQDSLTPSKAFVAMNLFNTIRQPMATLPMLISISVQCYVSMVRLQTYLSGEDLEKPDPAGCSEEFPLVMQNATYTWDRTLEPVLKNITVRIPKGKLVAVVGQVGVGKSSLLSAFLGEMECHHGRGSIQGSIAYVPQQAWIQNLTLRANILFEKPLRGKRYRRVIKACALEPDLELLPGGEMTEIGEKGINLSGGQKQRISLARAVYQDSDVYLLDDPLSAVDAHVGKHIFDSVLGPKGMIRKKTRVLVTHGIHWLPMVDMIIVMDQGRITESGTYQELMSYDGPFAQFVRTYLLEHEDEELNDPEVQQLKDQMIEQVGAVTSDEEYQHIRLRRSQSDPHERQKSDNSWKQKEKSVRSSVSAKEVSTRQSMQDKSEGNYQLIQEEKSEKGKVRSAVFISLLHAFGCLPAVMVPVCVIFYNGCNIGSGIWLSEWTDDSYLSNESHADTDKYMSKTYMYLGVYTAFSMLQVLGNSAFVLLVYVQFVNASQRLHNLMLNTILHQPMSFFDTTPLGRILNRFSRDVDVVDVNMSRQVRLVLQTFFNILSVIVVISYTTPIFLAVVAPILVIYLLFQKFYIPSSRQFRRIESTTRSPIFSHFAETIGGASSIRAYGVSDRFFSDSQDLIDINNKCFFAAQAGARWLKVRLEALGNCIVLFAGLFAVLSEDVTGSLVGLSVTYALQVTNSLNMMVQNMTQLETNSVSVERIVEYSKLPKEPEWIIPENRPQAGWPNSGTVLFENYSTRYRAQLDLVLRKISMKIKDGQKIGIVGRTGAGKSSLSLALFRIIEAAGGRILIDGLDISTIGLHDLRVGITILPQDPVLFSGSLRFNLDPFDVHSNEEIWKALENAHLIDFVKDLPGQLDYTCEESGQNLSVGQRQLMCLARSLLRKTKILILDEATAAVDLETDFVIQNTIREAFKHCTVLTVAHRLKTVIDYDKILVLSNGEILEFDTPEALLADKSGMFYSMAKESGLVQ